MTGGDDDDAWRPPAPARRPAPTEQLAGYSGLQEIGRGGDSVVYRATQDGLGRDVAIKVLDVVDPVRVARFEREIRITVGLGRQHPNIVTVLGIGTTESGRPAIIMDYYEGGTLHDRLKSLGPLAAEEVVRIGEVLADALSFAHERGVLHRDVKPQNVLVLPTSWVLADFGIARLQDSEHTSSAETFTYRHAAPQVLDGLPPTAADDVWSLGSTLYTLLDGRPPFASDDPHDDSALAYLRRVRVEEHRPLDVLGSERVAPVIERCLRKDLAERWSSAAELRDALRALRSTAWEPGVGQPGDGAFDRTNPRVGAFGRTDPRVTSTSAAPVTPAMGVTPPVPVTPPAPAESSAPPVTPSPSVEPPPVALSVASHAPQVADAQPTGTGLPDVTGPDPREQSPGRVGEGRGDGGNGVDDDEAPRQRRSPWILAAVALVIGLVLALVGTAIRGRHDDGQVPVSAPSSSGRPIPSLSNQPTDVPTFRGRFDPKLAFVLKTLTYDGATLHLEWTDPSDGEGRFYLEQVLPDEKPIYEFDAGTEVGDVPITLPPGRSCYYLVVALATGEFGSSGKPRCWPPGRG